MSDAAAPRPRRGARWWMRVGPGLLPFADAATPELPLARILRLGLFQVTVGMALVLLNGTLNRVMIVELGVPTVAVALMIALPVALAPFRALVGFRSDTLRTVLGWRRGPFIWFGTLLQFGGFAIMPFALLILSGDAQGPIVFGQIGACLAFLMVGAGIHTVQTAGLALATDLAPEAARPRVVALLYVMLLLGMAGSSLAFGALLERFDPIRLIQVVQGVAALTFALNLAAMWKQEPRDRRLAVPHARRPSFRAAWATYRAAGRAGRTLTAVALGAAAFAMQDVLLEPYGAEILGLDVGQTTLLTGILAAGTLIGFAIAAGRLRRGGDPYRLAALGALIGVAAFALIALAAPFADADALRAGTALIGLGGGLFSVGMLTAAMGLSATAGAGLALGAWGAAQATASGAAIAVGGLVRDGVGALAMSGRLGPGLVDPAVGYIAVWLIEILLLFAALAAVGPLVRVARPEAPAEPRRFGLAEFPT